MSGEVWYFAYGSNLDPGTFLERRRMRPRSARPGRLEGYRLVFDLRVGRGERAEANLEPSQFESVHGVAYALSHEDAARLDRTEGVHRGAYRRKDVRVELRDGGRVSAFTYVSPHRTRGRKPSERYLCLLLTGARHHGLPPDYVTWLDSFERAVDERRS